jgi:hypothetical protein
MNRYSNSTVTKPDNTEKRRLTTSIFPSLPASTSDILIRTTSVERLDKLAQQFYGDTTAWPVIAAANPTLKGTLVVPINTRLRIPAANRVQQFLNDINIDR